MAASEDNTSGSENENYDISEWCVGKDKISNWNKMDFLKGV